MKCFSKVLSIYLLTSLLEGTALANYCNQETGAELTRVSGEGNYWSRLERLADGRYDYKSPVDLFFRFKGFVAAIAVRGINSYVTTGTVSYLGGGSGLFQWAITSRTSAAIPFMTTPT